MNVSPFRLTGLRVRSLLGGALAVFGLGVPQVHAQEVATGTLTLSRTPLFVNQAVDPNVLVSFDDSGSMTNGFMPDTVDDNCGWRHPRYYWNGYNKVAFNPNVEYTPPLQPDATSFPDASFTAAWLDGYEAATSIVAGAGGSSTVNLSNRYFPTRSKNARDGTNHNTRVGHDYRAVNTTNCNNDGGASDGNAALPFGPASTLSSNRGTNVNSPAFYYRFTGSDPNDNSQVNDPGNYEAVNVATLSEAQKQNFANWYSYYRTRYLFARTAASRSFAVLDNNIRVAWQNFNQNQLGNSDEIRPLQGSWRTNFFNWLYRTNASGGTPLRASFIRAGDFFSRSGLNYLSPYFEPATATAPARELSCRQNFHIGLTDGFWNEGNPSHASDDDDTTEVTFPDGVTFPASPTNPLSRIYSNEPSSVPNAPTMADIAFYFWRRDLRPDLENNVPTFFPDLTTGVTGPAMSPGFDPRSVPEVYFNPANDPANWQHMVNFIVGLGVAGGLNYPGDFNALRTGGASWPAPLNNHFTGVDDTWHAALNSRGQYFSASDPTELVTALTRLFSSVQARRASITPISVSSPLLALGTQAFRTGFDTSDWSGTVVGLDFVPDDPTTPGNEESFSIRWQAEELLDARDPATRRILTSSTLNGGTTVNFEWGSLSVAQQNALRRNPATGALDTVAVGQARLNYIRGSRAGEFQNGGNFRNRSTVLGAVVNSGTAVVGRAREAYRDVPVGLDPAIASTDDYSFPLSSPERLDPYGDFVTSTLTRKTVVYAGANDGMLHAFDAQSGEELWAYVPFSVYPNLSRLTSQLDLDFQSFVDSTPTVRDVYVPGRGWRTILVVTMRLGAQSAFAIDVTNPDSPDVLWEYSDASPGGQDLGFTYGLPFLNRMHNGEWTVLLPGGYNSEVNDGSAGTRQAALYVLNIMTGSVIRKFTLGGGTIGLGSVVGGDYETTCDPSLAHFCPLTSRNVLDVTDNAFAGDLTGNVWRFDFRSSSPGSWSVERFARLPGPSGLLQPITARPWIPGTRDGRAVIMFGTGKYIEPGDRTRLIPTQTMYGIFDQGAGSSDYPINSRLNLLEQNLSQLGVNRRTLTTRSIDANIHRGWFFDLLERGERIVVQAGVRAGEGIGIVPSLIPLSEDPCRPNAESFLMFFDVSNGGIPGCRSLDLDNDGNPDTTECAVTFDTNGDGVVNAADDFTQVGLRVESFIAAVTPVTMEGGGLGRIVLPGLDGDITSVDSLVIPEYEWRRRTWRELFRE